MFRPSFGSMKAVLRASLAVTRGGQQPALFDAARRLAHAPLGLPRHWLSGLAPAQLDEGAQDCLRQLLWNHARGRFSAMCGVLQFTTGGRERYFAPLPGVWRRELMSRGMRLEILKSWTAFLAFQVAGFKSGVLRIAHYLRHAREFGTPSSPYAVLYFARSFNVPPRDCPPPHWDWVTWLLQSKTVKPGTQFWAVALSGGDVKRDGIVAVPNALPALRTASDYVAFLLASARIVTVTLGRWLTGAWWAPLMLREFIDVAYAGLVAQSDLAAAYYFPPQFMSLRPLWSWAAEARGIDSVMMFYSHNFQTTYLAGQPDLRATDATYSLMRWPSVVYMTDACGPYMESVGAAPHAHVVGGLVSMVDEGGVAPRFDRPAIAVLDMDPTPPTQRASMGLPQNWHSREVVRAFLDDVSLAIRELGAVPVWKLKGTIFEEEARHPGSLRYDRAAHRAIARKHGVVVCPDDVPVPRLVDAVDGAIVLPFTTPATVFRMLGKAAAYYDPTGTLGGFDLMARGAPVLTDPLALRAWLRDVLRDTVARQKVSA